MNKQISVEMSKYWIYESEQPARRKDFRCWLRYILWSWIDKINLIIIPLVCYLIIINNLITKHNINI